MSDYYWWKVKKQHNAFLQSQLCNSLYYNLANSSLILFRRYLCVLSDGLYFGIKSFNQLLQGNLLYIPAIWCQEIIDKSMHLRYDNWNASVKYFWILFQINGTADIHSPEEKKRPSRIQYLIMYVSPLPFLSEITKVV